MTSGSGPILTPAAGLRWSAQELRERAAGLALGTRALIADDRSRRPIHDRILRSVGRLGQIARELEQIADELDPQPPPTEPARGEVDQVYTFGVREPER